MLTIAKKVITPVQLISAGFVLLILAGTILLMLPVSGTSGTAQCFVDALFTATSAVSTTGLIVVDTPTYYSLFGQIVILVLVQIGGLGYMIFIVLISKIIKNRLSLNEKKYLRESISRLSKIELVRFAKLTIYITFVIELLGTLVYFIVWVEKMSITDAAWFSIFHSISAFCTAGFSMFSSSLMDYRDNIIININSNILAIFGAVGFFVIYDVLKYLKDWFQKYSIKKITLHSKVVLSTTFILLLLGSVIVLFSEGSRFSDKLWNNFLYSTFQVISASTTVGFNSIDIGKMSDAGQFVIIILMIIGASPGSTGGGIKTTSFAVFSAFSFSKLRGKEETSLFKRTINFETYDNSAAQIFVAITAITIFMLLLTITEKFDFIKLLFEAASAFGTVGLSTGITFNLTDFGKIWLTILMLIGRIGPLAIGFSFFRKKQNINYHYPEEEVMVS